MHFLKPYTFFVILSLVISTASVALTLYFPILIGYAIDCIVGKGNVDFKTLINLILRAGVIVIITAVLQWLIGIINNKVTFEVIKDIRKEAFKKLQILPLSYLDRRPKGDTISRIISDVDTFADGLLLGFSSLFTGIITIIGTLFFMFLLNPIIALAVVVITPLSLLVARFISKKTYSLFTLQSKIRAEQTSLIDEAVGNNKVVKAFSQEENTVKKFDEINEKLKDCSLKATFYSSLVNPSTRFVNSLVYAAVGSFGAFAVIGAFGNGVMTVGMLSSFLSYANQYTKPFNEISGVITELQNAVACVKRIFEFINETPQVPDCDNALTLKNAKGNILINNVQFSYDKTKELIKDFNLDVKSGMSVAIVGPTGCGKTTVINLLMRFYDADSGKITVDGNEIKKTTRSSLRENYGMILQETWIKDGTVRDNIVIGKPDATLEEVINAAKLSHAHNFIKRLPYGYDTVISDEGGILSQGQRQLLCIARVMLKIPPMLILDEATSSIDTRTELKIQSAFNTLMQGRTSFIVAHRLSTVKQADIIIVMKDGNIVERGKHSELIKKDGFYAKLYNSQFEQ
ncbi:MAG: ABC transporter ATP-binding protein/permease [Clostridia bacterium]|nr:ABC transporter ATP-binding protein/permease [Clostridia bacterium]